MIPSTQSSNSSQQKQPQTLTVLGSTGSIGTQTLEIVRLFPEVLSVHALAAGSNWTLLAAQALEFNPKVVCLADDAHLPELREALAGTSIDVRSGLDSMAEIAAAEDVDIVVAAIVGAAGLRPTLAAVEAGKKVALANKETLVVAGSLVRKTARTSGSVLIPVDSEHSAIFQCLVGEPANRVESITLTASGGPFRDRPLDTFGSITRAEALNHPNWSMGAKITIDSATMMNKGLEVIEAHWLFDKSADDINVVIHPQSIIHSFVTFSDGSAKAQLGVPDMKVPIQYALSYPERWEANHPRIDWTVLKGLDFETPDFNRFPNLRLAFDALEQGGCASAVLNAANEVAVQLFLEEQIGFADIPLLIEKALENVPSCDANNLETLIHLDRETRARVQQHSGILVS